MANVLEKIVADKRIELEQLKQDKPLSTFIDSLLPSTNSFYDALAAPGTSYVFECKKASPSKGLIREHFDLDEITSAYEKEAACFSVLTDEKYFQGKHEYLRYVSAKVKQPTLNKDFFIDTYQVHLARHLNANAVLLMLSVLDDESYVELSECAKSLGMDVLTEVSNSEETQRALALNANIIGINNRNLRDLSTDLSTTEKLVTEIRDKNTYKGLIISESGIYTNADIQRLGPLVDGFLVGSALMQQKDLDIAVSQLVYGAVKVCGVTSREQANLIAKYPVSYLGLIFAPISKRYISLESALEIVKEKANFVGVFVDHAPEIVAEYAHKLQLSAVQLHGNEDADYIANLSPLLPERCELWKAQGISADTLNADVILASIHPILPLLEKGTINRLLLDCKLGNQIGGTGQSFNWRLIKQLSKKQIDIQKLVIAGGIDISNVKDASHIGAGLIDVNSGVESHPGIKTSQKLTNLFATLRT
ncbi:bifunctional indole-3-glycerol-phosphate synthase TrpC/phosphoribosylanthranilate isomerase TrpF [Glaciecola petra]|uniref:Multifunctional fusion protein n=1 Tax=Glaciecola petra TaxID=3075602 RepID=A0ABU2ZPP9_9ALTE|nr:bifunctional indole-3-glycerol-phosphate synthase TrpC/phosphoribosylanthranilate isomerase TrpF [Aestuariibacter sp. P117]MDT0594598.1 bifunctional indole-3-glycerol-phosphate synthase TrpC/phosphoribosylanthranilate isomerase TrpF [Aestuariibacter sp. P117]